jgi:glycosyltransferase involved in cell wall biosynthesis
VGKKDGVELMSAEFLCQVDHLAHRDGAIFGFGWAIDEKGPFKRGYLKLAFYDGRMEVIDLLINRDRKDVAASFPQYPHSAKSGFMFLAGWVGVAPIGAQLEFITISDVSQVTNLAVELESSQAGRQGIKIQVLFERARRMLRQGDFKGLWSKTLRFRDAGGFAREGTEAEILSLLGNNLIRLVIDHSMGGGANVYRERQIQGWLANSQDSVVLLTFSLKYMDFILEIHANGQFFRRRIHDFSVLASLFLKVRLREVFINCLVSFPSLPELERAVYRWVKASNAHLIVAIHEYFVICPSHFLLDWQGRYCGIPESIADCQRCLNQHRDGFVSLAGNKSILQWRKVWGGLLQAADEIRCFSASSIGLVQKVYPDLNHQLTLTPHSVEKLRKPNLPLPAVDKELVIGVVGSITEHKGALVLGELADAIAQTGAAVRIVILGVLDASITIDGVTETGLYELQSLPELMEKMGIHLALMPSVCPETFSFVTHELILMQVPIACFGLGAQGEIVSRYSLGHILSARNGVGLLEELVAFGREIPDKISTQTNIWGCNLGNGYSSDSEEYARS